MTDPGTQKRQFWFDDVGAVIESTDSRGCNWYRLVRRTGEDELVESFTISHKKELFELLTRLSVETKVTSDVSAIDYFVEPQPEDLDGLLHNFGQVRVVPCGDDLKEFRLFHLYKQKETNLFPSVYVYTIWFAIADYCKAVRYQTTEIV